MVVRARLGRSSPGPPRAAGTCPSSAHKNDPGSPSLHIGILWWGGRFYWRGGKLVPRVPVREHAPRDFLRQIRREEPREVARRRPRVPHFTARDLRPEPEHLLGRPVCESVSRASKKKIRSWRQERPQLPRAAGPPHVRDEGVDRGDVRGDVEPVLVVEGAAVRASSMAASSGGARESEPRHATSKLGVTGIAGTTCSAAAAASISCSSSLPAAMERCLMCSGSSSFRRKRLMRVSETERATSCIASIGRKASGSRSSARSEREVRTTEAVRALPAAAYTEKVTTVTSRGCVDMKMERAAE